jgi:hypothetical protein
MRIFRHIFPSNYWWQKSDIWSQTSYRYPILWEAFFDPSDSYFLFAKERGYHKWALAYSSSCFNSKIEDKKYEVFMHVLLWLTFYINVIPGVNSINSSSAVLARPISETISPDRVKRSLASTPMLYIFGPSIRRCRRVRLFDVGWQTTLNPKNAISTPSCTTGWTISTTHKVSTFDTN